MESAIYPLVHERMPFSQYIELKGEHSTSLRRALVSPLEYKHFKTHERDDSDTLRVGRAVHTATLEPLQFLREYVLWEGGRRAGKIWDAFEVEHAGKTILKEEQYTPVTDMARSIQSHAVAGPLLAAPGRSELTIQWRHESGTLCKARIDRLGEALIDIKTARDITPHGFAASAYRFGYHVQAAFYADACKAAGLGTFPVRFVVVQNKAPYDVVVYDVDDAQLDKGREEYERALLLIAQCTRDNKWPGQAPSEPVLLRLPAWAAPEFNEEEAIQWGTEVIV
jgi:hypothetical protein